MEGIVKNATCESLEMLFHQKKTGFESNPECKRTLQLQEPVVGQLICQSVPAPKHRCMRVCNLKLK